MNLENMADLLSGGAVAVAGGVCVAPGGAALAVAAGRRCPGAREAAGKARARGREDPE